MSTYEQDRVNNVRIEIERLIREHLNISAACEAERLIRWPDNTPFKGAEEEAQAAVLDRRTDINRAFAHQLSLLLEMLP